MHFKMAMGFPPRKIDVLVYTLGFGSIKTNSGVIAPLVWFKCECCHLHLGVQCAPNKPHHFRGSRSTSSWTLECNMDIFLSIPEPTKLNSKCKHTLKRKWNALIVMQGCVEWLLDTSIDGVGALVSGIQWPVAAGAKKNWKGANKLNHTVNSTAYDWMKLLNHHLTSDIIMNHYCLRYKFNC